MQKTVVITTVIWGDFAHQFNFNVNYLRNKKRYTQSDDAISIQIEVIDFKKHSLIVEKCRIRKEIGVLKLDFTITASGVTSHSDKS